MKIRKMKYTDTLADGTAVKRETKKFYASWQDFRGIMRRMPLTADRRSAESIAAKVNQLNSLASAREPIPADLTRWIEQAAPKLIAQLAKWGIIPASRVSAVKALKEHVDEFERSLIATTSKKHAQLQTNRIRAACEGCSFMYWGEISASKLEGWLSDRRQDTADEQGASASTRNHYLVAFKSFCNWMVEDRRASENPIRHLSKVDEQNHKRRSRRALTLLEYAYILDAARQGEEHHTLGGKERAILYQLAAETGFRASELRSLTPQSFFIPIAGSDGEGKVTILGAYSKNKRTDTLPLRPEMVEVLRPWLARKMPHAPVFSLKASTKTAEMLRKDADVGRAAYIAAAETAQERQDREQSDFLVYKDGAGRQIDFHALRHTFLSNLAAGGVHPKVAQELARHQSIELTMGIYTHTVRGAHSDALASLPNAPTTDRQRAVATGTAGKINEPSTLSASLSPVREQRRTMANNGERLRHSPLSVSSVENSGKPRENRAILSSELVLDLSPTTDWESASSSKSER